MRRISETLVCDRCGCSGDDAILNWKVKVIEGKEYDLCSKCAEWFDKLENGRRVVQPYVPDYPHYPRYPYRPYDPWPWHRPRDWMWYATGTDTTDYTLTCSWWNSSGKSGTFDAPQPKEVCIYATS